MDSEKAMTTVALATLGCKTNQFESAAMYEALANAGYSLIPFDQPADIYVINTCTVTSRADAESRKLIRRAARCNPVATIIVTGCYAQVAAEEALSIPGVRMVIGNREKRDLISILSDLESAPSLQVQDIMNDVADDPLPVETFAEHTRAFLQIQNGCNAFCSYCIVPYARGRSRSVTTSSVLEAVHRFADQGYQEIVLTGIHLGAYGLDLSPRTDLFRLLKEIESSPVVPRLRLGSIEPLEISPEMIGLLAASDTLCPHLHIPLQSAADSVLSRMNRHYTTGWFRDLVDRLLTAMPDLTIGLDLIAGFPGETEDEFSRGVAFLRDLPFSYAHVFPYSQRQGTPAATMTGQLSPGIIKERSALLRAVGEEKRRAWQEKWIGRKLEVLIQEKVRGGSYTGLARNYLPVNLTSESMDLSGELPVLGIATSDKGIEGKVIHP